MITLSILSPLNSLLKFCSFMLFILRIHVIFHHTWGRNIMNTLPKSLTIAFLALSIFISGLSADLVKAQSLAPEPMVTLTPEEQDWLRAHPDVTFGFTYSFEPFLIRGDRGQHIGIVLDLLK